MTKAKKYWKGLAEINNSPLVEKLKQNEFTEEIPVDEFLGDKEISATSTSRRDFLKFLGFSTAAATLAACEAPIIKSIPYVVKPDEIIPGIANYYATTMYDGHDYASVLVKNREGRPIKIDANKSAPNARVQASILSLYDSSRLKNPLINNTESDWNTADSQIISQLNKIKQQNGKIAILTSTVISPSTKKLIQNFTSYYKNVSHVEMDSISYDGMLEANQFAFGVRALPNYSFDKADVVVSFGADFLGNWLNCDYASDYASNRNPESGKMSKHYQIESALSLSGSNADERIQIKPSEQSGLLTNLYNALSGSKADSRILKIVGDLLASKGKSIVISNSNDVKVQTLVNAINDKLGNYENTITLTRPSYLKQGNNKDVAALIKDMNNGNISALFTHNVNPAYTLQDSVSFVEGLSKVSLKVSTSLYNDESASKMTYVLPDHHYLESWGDSNPAHGEYTLMQPTIAPLFNSRQFQESLMVWIGTSDYHNYLQSFYKDIDWNKSVHDGYFTKNTKDVKVSSFKGKVESFNLSKNTQIEFEMYEKISMGDGTQSNNPWLQELPDPISRACWDNYLAMSAPTARKIGVTNWNVSNGALNGSLVNITVNNKTYKNVPVMIQPGQAVDTVSMAVGYGRESAGKCGNGIGFNAFTLGNGDAKIELLEGEYEFAATQLHHTMMGREIIKETTLADFIKDPQSGNHKETYSTHKGKQPADMVTLWDEHDHSTGHFWNMSIDLTSCLGCSACVISCHAENNVPVVGKEEIRKSRDMHWLRIDRYFSSDMTKELSAKEKVSPIDMYSEMEEPSVNPEVAFQPVMCQHCNHAPCETVCPVAATSHSAEGLNHMAYNRCVGTRYCANNCPYKVRRFNWFQYSENDKFDFNMNDDYGKMVLNPDVVVRSRGVIEKCSMCIQKIQKVKLDAKKSGKRVKDEDAQTACSSACPTNAIVFGDVNDDKHKVQALKKTPRAYKLLEHLNTDPSVFYQTKIRNKA